MACEGKCSYVIWEADRPELYNWGLLNPSCYEIVPTEMPEEALDQLAAKIMREWSSVKRKGCPNCDCETSKTEAPELVLEVTKTRGVADWVLTKEKKLCYFQATFTLRLRKYRIDGECAPRSTVAV